MKLFRDNLNKRSTLKKPMTVEETEALGNLLLWSTF